MSPTFSLDQFLRGDDRRFSLLVRVIDWEPLNVVDQMLIMIFLVSRF